MQKNKRPEKAYKNLEFLNSAAARTIRILSEFYEPQSRFKKHRIIDTVVFFGSARLLSGKESLQQLRKLTRSNDRADKNYMSLLKNAERICEMSRYYDDAVELSRRLTEWSLKLPLEQHRFIVCTGGGPGIMEAANKGAKIAGGPSLGLNISIPYEQFVNKYVDKELAFEFHYFFMRKFWLIYLAKALVVFPGGFGTLDELMEVLTLTQTGKITKKMKVVIYDEEYWKEILNFDKLIEYGMINKKDMKLFNFCNNVDDAFTIITEHFKKHYLAKFNKSK